MFNKFLKEYRITSRINSESVMFYLNYSNYDSLDFNKFMREFSGSTFNNGLYRIHLLNDIDRWTNITIEAFPFLKDRIKCFAYDWLGRQFVLDYKRIEDSEPMILMLEPGTGEVLEIPATFLNFHEVELVEYMDEALAVNFFKEWYQYNKVTISHEQCVGYKTPLFLGGKDTIDNLEVSDMEVYWGISSQLF